jgi:O-antigen/teichoic acid export membrane protein
MDWIEPTDADFRGLLVHPGSRQMLKKLVYLPGYFAVSTITAIARFFFVSLLIRNLGAAEFGRWSLFEPVVVVLSQLVLLGVNFGLIKQINQDKLSPIAAVRALLLAGQPLLIGVSTAVFFVSFRLGLSWPGPLFLALLIYTESIFLLLFSSYRASGSIGGFAVSSFLKVLAFLTVLVLALYDRLPAFHKAEDVIFWSFWASLVGLASGFLAVRLLHFRRFFTTRRRRVSHWRIYGDAVRYGLPLLATGLLAMAIEFAARYILDFYIDRGQLATYVIYAKLSSIVEVLIITPFGLWWPTERFRWLESRDGGRRFFRAVSVGMLVVLLVAAGVLWLASEWVVSWFAPGVPSNRHVALLLIFSMVARGMAYPLNVGALKEGKTHWNIYGALAAATVNGGLCLFLIPRAGIVGAAYATIFSHICYTAFLTVISQRIHPVPLPYLTMVGLILISALLIVAVSRYLEAVPSLLKALIFSAISLIVFTPIVAPMLRVKNAE